MGPLRHNRSFDDTPAEAVACRRHKRGWIKGAKAMTNWAMTSAAGLIAAITIAPTMPAWAFEPSVSISLGEQPHTISGRTNFPNGTVLTLSLYRAESGFVNSVDVVVNKGVFRTLDLSASNAPMDPGNYKVEVWTAPGFGQPASVRDVIGENGEKLSGPDVHVVVDPTYDMTTTITVPGTPNTKQDAKFKQAARDREVSGIGGFCQQLYGQYGDSKVNSCADKAISKIPD
jgi:hypothetical protein